MLCENFLEQNLHLLLVFYTLLKWVISAETAESKLGLQYERIFCIRRNIWILLELLYLKSNKHEFLLPKV